MPGRYSTSKLQLKQHTDDAQRTQNYSVRWQDVLRCLLCPGICAGHCKTQGQLAAHKMKGRTFKEKEKLT